MLGDIMGFSRFCDILIFSDCDNIGKFFEINHRSSISHIFKDKISVSIPNIIDLFYTFYKKYEFNIYLPFLYNDSKIVIAKSETIRRYQEYTKKRSSGGKNEFQEEDSMFDYSGRNQ